MLVHDEGLRVEGVGFDLALAKAVFGFQPLEVGRHPFLGDEQRQRLQILELRHLGFRMVKQDLRVLLEHGGDRDQRHVVGDRVERLQRVRAHEEVELARDQEHAVVLVGPARHDGDVEPVILVGAVGDRLKEAAMLGLGDPIGAERDLVQGLCGGRRQPDTGQQGCG